LETIGTRTKNKGEALGKAGAIQEWRDANDVGHGLFDIRLHYCFKSDLRVELLGRQHIKLHHQVNYPLASEHLSTCTNSVDRNVCAEAFD